MKKNCEMIRDMLPLYIEDMCSDETKKFVNEHLADCKDCRDQLDKLNTNVAVKANTDIKAIKKVKNKLRIGKAVVALVALVVGFSAAFFGFYIPMSITKTMDYEKYNLAENVWVEEDSDGTVWLCKKDDAATADLMLSNLKDTNGNYMSKAIYSPKATKTPQQNPTGYDKDSAEGYVITLQHRRFNELSFIKDVNNKTERTELFNINENTKMQHIYYYDNLTDTEYVLWERAQNN